VRLPDYRELLKNPDIEARLYLGYAETTH